MKRDIGLYKVPHVYRNDREMYMSDEYLCEHFNEMACWGESSTMLCHFTLCLFQAFEFECVDFFLKCTFLSNYKYQ